MRGRGPGRRGVRLFTDFWRENLNFPALSITNRRGGGRWGGGVFHNLVTTGALRARETGFKTIKSGGRG